MPNPTISNAGESGLLFAKNKITNQTETIATTANMQVGLPNKPSDLTIYGTTSLSTVDVTLVAGTTYEIQNNVTNINVTTTGASGTVTLHLPSKPKKGQIIYVKDGGGAAGTVSITIQGSPSGTTTVRGTTNHLIDGSSSKTITTNYGVIQLIWNGSEWYTITSTSAGGGGGGAPIDASYVVIGSNATLTNERILTAGTGISIVDGGAGSTVTLSATSTANVTGPGSSTDNAIVRFNGISGNTIQDSVVTIEDTTGNITTPGDIAVNGGDITTTSSTFNLLNEASTLNIGTTAVARTINLGSGAATQTVNIGSSSNSSAINIRSGSENISIESGAGYIEIGTTGALAGTRLVKIGSTPSMQTNVTLGSTTGTSSMIIDCGTGALEIATSASGRTCNIATGNATQYVTLGSGNGSSELILNSGTGDIRIGGTNSARRIMIGSNIDVSSAYKQSIYIGAKAVLTGNYVAVCDGTSSTGHEVRIISEGAVVDPGGVHSVRIGTTPDTCLTALGSLSGSSYTHIFGGSTGILLESKSNIIFSGSTGTSYTMGSALGVGTITLGQSTASNTIDIGNANTSTGNTQTINIGSGTPSGTGKSVITIGNTSGASSIVVQSGTGDVKLNSTDSIQLQYVGPISILTRIEVDSTGIGFFGTAPVVQQSVASDTLANLYTALRNYGLIV